MQSIQFDPDFPALMKFSDFRRSECRVVRSPHGGRMGKTSLTKLSTRQQPTLHFSARGRQQMPCKSLIPRDFTGKT
jgi:hypothetical protein